MGLQVLSFTLMQDLTKRQKINKILKIVKSGDIVMVEGRFSPEFETELTTSALQSVSGRFSGIEVAFLEPHKSKNLKEILIHSILKLLAKNRIGITVIGPSKVIKEIKMNPQRLEILFK